jgi:hypothetical protein
MTDFIQFTVSPESDPKGEKVRAILDAHLGSAHTRAAREFWVHLLALVGALIILLPQATSAEIRAILLALWGVCGVCAVVAAVLEWGWRWREGRLLAATKAGLQP